MSPDGGNRTTHERHVLILDGCEFVVEVNEDGSVGLYFQDFGQAPLVLTPAEFGKAVAFAEQHGQVTVVER